MCNYTSPITVFYELCFLHLLLSLIAAFEVIRKLSHGTQKPCVLSSVLGLKVKSQDHFILLAN